jgi:hypothetical protein
MPFRAARSQRDTRTRAHLHPAFMRGQSCAVVHHGTILRDSRTSGSAAVSYAGRAAADLVMQTTSPSNARERNACLGYQAGGTRRDASALFFRVNGDAAAAAGVSLGIGLSNRGIFDGLVLIDARKHSQLRAHQEFFPCPLSEALVTNFWARHVQYGFSSCESLRPRLLPRSVILPPSSK